MQALLKFTLLIFAFCLNLFSFQFPDPNQYSLFMNLNYFPGMRQIDAELISDEYFRYRNDIYKIDSTFDYFVLSPSKFNDFAIYASYFYFFNPTPKTAYCEGANTDQTTYRRNCSVEKIDVRQKIEYQNVKKITASKVATCEPNQSFDPDTQKCYRDCSKDGGINNVGLPDGRCIDCSGEKDSFSVLKCLCSGFGLGGGNTFWSKDGSSSSSDCKLQGSCSDGSQIPFTNPKCSVNPDQKPDDNKTKPDNPNPDNNKTKPGDPNNPNQGGGNQGGNQGGNNGGNQGDNTNPNPDPKPNPKPGNGNSTNNNNGGGNNTNGDNLKFNETDFNYDGLKGDYEGFKNRYASEVEGLKGKFDDLKTGLNQFIENVKGNGFTSFQKNSVQNTCPLKYNVELGFYSSVIEVDFCKLLEPIRTIIYYFVYIAVFTGFLLLTVKLIMFSF